MKIRNIVFLFSVILIAELTILSFVMVAIIRKQQELTQTENRRYQAYKLADELRQSSDDLTRMARTYVVTGDPVFERYFNDILAIRDGKKPLPLAYDRIYWDFVIASQETPDKAGPAISLIDRMESLDLTGKEREQLRLAKANSDALVALENKAMNAVKGLFDDGSQGYVAGRPPDLELARSIMFGEDYHAAKAAIMKPIDNFLVSLENRMNAAVAGQRKTVRFLMTTAAFLVALTLVTFGTLAIVIRRRVIGPVETLVQQSEVIREGAYGYQVAVKRDDEIGVLAGALNRMSTAISDDVEKRQKVKEALLQQTEFLNTILEASPIAATIVNADATFEFVNSRALEMWGVSKEEFLASDARDLYVDPNDRDKIFERLSKQRSLRDIEVQFKNRGDTPFWALVSLEPTGLGDQPQYFTWIYDITVRKEAEEELRQSEQRLQAIFETSPIGVAIVNRDGTWAFVNSRLVEMLGTSREKFLASNARDLYVNPNERDRIYERLLECGHLHDVEIQVKRADGTLFWVMVSFEPIEKGNQSQHFAWVNDITERKKAEDALRSSKEEAEAALENLKKTQAQLVHSQRLASLGELTAGIAHEIKNPLNFVNNFAETSLELIEELREQIEQAGDRFDGKTRENLDDLSGALKEDLGTINIHGRRADGIVKSMLLHAQADGSDRVEAALNPLVSETLNLAYHGERAKDKSFQVTLEEELAETTGAAEVVPQAITRVLLNLIGNAFYAVKKRAQEAGDENYQPTVSVTTRGRGDRIEILVRDNGTGIPKDIQEKLFEPFFTTKPPGEGTGLGLSICYDIIVQQHGGQMVVDSKIGEFTEFSIELPRHSGKVATRHKNPEAG